jgi:hypothetical protein
VKGLLTVSTPLSRIGEMSVRIARLPPPIRQHGDLRASFAVEIP